MTPIATESFTSLSLVWCCSRRCPLFSRQTVRPGGTSRCEGVSYGGERADRGEPSLPLPHPGLHPSGSVTARPRIGSASAGFPVSLPPHLLCGLSSQVFDATNTTRERRDMILNFAKENSFKVGPWLRAGMSGGGEPGETRGSL